MLQTPVANGQLSTVSGTEIVGQGTTTNSTPNLQPPGSSSAIALSCIFTNTNAANQTINVKISRQNGTARSYGPFVGVTQNQKLLLNNITIAPGDSLQAWTTTASAVDYDITAVQGGGPMTSVLIDTTGAIVQTGNTAVPAGNLAVAGTLTVTSANASSFAVGRQGATNPSLQVDSSAGTALTGLKITAAGTGAGVAVAAIETGGTNNALTIDAMGSGTLTLNGTATGNVIAGANLQITDAKNIVLATTTGTTIGTATTQKLAFWNATPIVQPTNATDLYTVLVNTGLIASGGTPAFSPPGMVNIADAKNIVLATTTGTQIATATTQKLGFYGATPVVQPTASTNATTGTTGASTGVSLDTTFKGASGSTAYTIGGIVTQLKALGLIAA